MASKNKTIISLVVLIVLVGLIFLLKEDPYEKTEDKALPDLPKIEAQNIDKLEFVNKTESITFEKRGERWWTSSPKEYLVDDNFDTLVLKKIEKLALDRVVSENKEKHKKFEVDESGSQVKVFSKGQALLSVIIGKNTPDYRGTFVRLPDSDVVYATMEVIGGGLKKKLKDWRDKKIFDVDAMDIQKLAFKLKKESYSLARVKPEPPKDAGPEAKDATPEAKTPPPQKGWELVGDDKFNVDKTRANNLASTISGMRWSEIVDEPKSLAEYGLGKPKESVTLTIKDADEKTMFLGKIDEEKRVMWVSLKGDPKVYQIRKYQYERLTKEKDHYRGDSPEK